MDRGLSEPPLVGREIEVSALTALLDGAAAGRGGVVLILGAPGTGKTRLLAVARQLAIARGMAVRTARGSEREVEEPYGVTRQLFGPCPGRRGSGISDELCWRVADLAAAGQDSAMMLAVDDAQRADWASMDLLVRLGLRVEKLPISIIVAAGTDRLREPIEQLRGDDRIVVLRLRDWDAAGVAELVRRVDPGANPDLAGACLRSGAGNPFLTVELLSAGAVAPVAAAPDRVRDSVASRLARLAKEDVRLARAVAVLGDGAALRLAATVAGLDRQTAEAAADALAVAGLLLPASPLRFAQPILLNAVYAESPLFARAAAHRRAATLLAAAGADDDVVAGHLLRAEPGEDPWVASQLTAAAAAARERGDPAAASRYLIRALAEPVRPDRLVDTLLSLSEALLSTADPAADDHLQQALSLECTPHQRARALALLARLRELQGDTAAGVRALSEALTELDVRDDAAGPLISGLLTISSIDVTQHHRANALIEPMLCDARHGVLPSDPGVAAHVALRLALDGDRAELVRRAADRALGADLLIDPTSHGALLGFAVRALIGIDQLWLAEQATTRSLESARRRGAVFAASAAGYHRALVRYHRGALAEALADLTGLEPPRQLGRLAAGPWIGELLVRLHVATGELTRAREALRLTDGTRPTSLAHPHVTHARSLLALAELKPAAALRAAREVGRSLREFGMDRPVVVPWRHTAALAAHALGRDVEAMRLADEALAAARAGSSARLLGAALHTAGVVAGRGAGIELLREARTVLQDSPAALQSCAALVDLGRALRHAGLREAAREPLRDAFATASDLHARPLAERARMELVAAGARPRRAALAGPAALTMTERRVADLAARGDTNAGVAVELSVSLKTVETHLRNVFRKLAIRRRTELRDALAGSVAHESSGWPP